MTALRVAILQAPAPDLDKAEAAWDALLDRIDEAARDEPDLVVLPEASYPAWFLGQAASTAPATADSDVLAALAGRARVHQVYIAAGLILGRPSTPENAAVLIAPDGHEVVRAGEASAGAAWFRAGRGPAAATLAGLRVALVAGADLLDPRFVLDLAGRADIVISTGAPRTTVRGGTRTGDVAGFVLPTRAVETGAWVVSAGRVGTEDLAIAYGGGAGVVSPRGEWAVRAPADRPGIVLHELDVRPAEATAAQLPDDYSATPASAPRGSTRVSALALDPGPSAVDLVEAVRASVRRAAALGARLVVLPDLSGADPRAVTLAETLPLIEATSTETRTAIVATLAERAGGALYRTCAVIDGGRTLESHRQASISTRDHRAGFTAGSEAPPVVMVEGAGAVGVLAGREALSPGAAASLRRRGAQLLAWSAGDLGVDAVAVARTRAWEQRLPVLAAGSTAGGACIVAAGGHLATATPEGTAMLVHGEVERLGRG
ncbi:MAG: carbon-nitrogen hydrolase family protein [Dehalococcoidia bacterium]|nr:carbon-nitrogen hydrolase family protein [Dehalococcoidia bacterium]